MWNKMMKKKAGVERQNSKKGLERNEHACSVEGVFVVSDPTARPYLKLAGPTREIQSSDRSESEGQKSRTRRWGSLA